MKIIDYNKSSSEKFGWRPNWFDKDATDINEDLISKIKEWQKSMGLSPDGLVGPTTFRRIFTERESKIDSFLPGKFQCKEINHIVYGGNLFEIEWPHVTLWSEENGFIANEGTYKKHPGKRPIDFFVNHWDVCLSAESCARVVNKRGISIHFIIDNDGRIFQMLDMSHIAWQAGGKGWNSKSIGVEISNAYYPKYQNWYVKKGFGERPLISDQICHGVKLKPFLGFYPVQIEALKALWKAVNKATGIPLEVPLTDSGENLTTVLEDTVNVKGFINHFNLTRNKIDCAGLDLKSLVEEIKSE